MNMSGFNVRGSLMRTVWSALMSLGLAVLFSGAAQAQAPAASGGAAPPPSSGDLTQLVGRIALYPDDLVAIILPASTSPLQIVQADRYLEKRKSDPKLPIDDKWDDPVKSLLNYPDVVKMMSNDLDWTSALGEEVVADQGAVLEAVQVFRRKAQAAGNLKSDTKQVVKSEKEVIIIEPADPQVVYVPQYNPSTVVVYGAAPAWGYYPTPYPSYYYPYAPGAAMAAGVIWGAAIGAAWSGNHYGWGGGNDININRNTNISTGGNTVNRGQGGQGSQWKSNKQPGQVSSSVGKTAPSNRAGDARGGSTGGRGSASSAGGYDRGGAGAGGDRGGAGAGGDRGGAGAGGGRASTQPAGGGHGGGDSALGGYNSGRQTQMDSSRGASSRGSSYGGGGGGAAKSSSYGGGGGGARPTASTGASRGGGGGGGAPRGGGGGGRGGGRR